MCGTVKKEVDTEEEEAGLFDNSSGVKTLWNITRRMNKLMQINTFRLLLTFSAKKKLNSKQVPQTSKLYSMKPFQTQTEIFHLLTYPV